jgi:hypothetical protein
MEHSWKAIAFNWYNQLDMICGCVWNSHVGKSLMYSIYPYNSIYIYIYTWFWPLFWYKGCGKNNTQEQTPIDCHLRMSIDGKLVKWWGNGTDGSIQQCAVICVPFKHWFLNSQSISFKTIMVKFCKIRELETCILKHKLTQFNYNWQME